MAGFVPKCKTGTIEHFISADLRYFPCCFICNPYDRELLEQYLGPDLWRLFDLRHFSVEEASTSEAMQSLELSWQTGAYESCIRACSKERKKVQRRESNNETPGVLDFNKWEINA
jgi:hypothetical protein